MLTAAGLRGEPIGLEIKDGNGVSSSFRIGQQTIYPEELHERLKGFALLENVGDAALRNLLSEANWFALPGGTLLERDGENNAALFLVVTGSLGVFVEGERGHRQMVAHIPAGETVGEMSLISGSSNHSAQLVALRDTELLRISPDGFEALIARHPRVMMNLMQMLVKRLKDANRGSSSKSRPKTFAIVPLQEGLNEVPIAQRLANALAGMGCRAAVLDAGASDQTAEWFNSFEAAHDIVFYRGDAPDSPWTHLCLRQADRIFCWHAPISRCPWHRWGCQPSRLALQDCPICFCCILMGQARCCPTISRFEAVCFIPITICGPGIWRM